MKILLISTPIFPIPLLGYGGLEELVHKIAVGMHAKGHQVSVVAPAGSKLPDGVELIACPQGQDEEIVYHSLYRARIESGEFDVIHDHSWNAWAYMSAIGREPVLPILHTCHGVPQVYGKAPPMPTPCFVGISDQHCNDIRMHLGIDARRVYNGIDTEMYKIDPAMKREGRYLFLGRYTAEKGPLVAINLARRTNVALDVIGDLGMVADKTYVDRCRTLCDGLRIRFMPAITRESTVKMYQARKALLFPLQWSEPYGMVVVEASLCGMPILTLNRGAMPELVKNGENGFVCKNEDELATALKEDWAAKIDPQKARAAVMGFTTGAMVDAYESIYQDVAAGRRW